MRKSAQNLTNWHTLWIQSLPSTLKHSPWPYSYFTLSKLSNETKFAQIVVQTTKLWPEKVGKKTGESGNVTTCKGDVVTWPRASPAAPTMSQRLQVMSRCSGSVLGSFWPTFEPKIASFKASNPRNKMEDEFGGFLGFLGCFLGIKSFEEGEDLKRIRASSPHLMFLCTSMVVFLLFMS